MISKLPKWVEYGAFILAFVAGYINAVGLLGFEHQSVSHVSGTATLFGASFLEGTFDSAVHLFGILIAFFIGASLSGFLLNGASLTLGRHYDTALLAESVLIFVAYYLLSKGMFYGHYAASAACGIQNALASTYSGAVIRTTHLTGIFTDLGIMFGSALRGDFLDKRKAILLLLIVIGFIVGGIVGTYLFGQLNFGALIAPSIICIILAACYRIYLIKYS